MEWTNQGGEPRSSATHSGSRKNRKLGPFSLRVVFVVLLFCTTILIVAIVWLVALSSSPTPENKFVDGSKLQAVFLNGGQVYFGNIKNLNDKYVRLSNIYYLRVNQTVQPDQKNANGTQAATNDISLVKLGCELHGPQDDMLINRDMVIFWENLKADGKVATAVADYVKQNPNGQNCNANTNS